MQRHQRHKFILNQPQKICTSTQSHWKDQQFSCLWQNPTQNRNEWKRHKNAKRAICHWTIRKASSTTRCGERRRLLARRGKHSLWRVGIYSSGDQKHSLWRVGNYGDQVHSLGERWHLLARRVWALVVVSDERQVSEQTSVLTPKP